MIGLDWIGYSIDFCVFFVSFFFFVCVCADGEDGESCGWEMRCDGMWDGCGMSCGSSRVDEINVGNFFCLYSNNCSPGFVLYSQYFLY